MMIPMSMVPMVVVSSGSWASMMPVMMFSLNLLSTM